MDLSKSFFWVVSTVAAANSSCSIFGLVFLWKIKWKDIRRQHQIDFNGFLMPHSMFHLFELNNSNHMKKIEFKINLEKKSFFIIPTKKSIFIMKILDFF